jgi:hypothetical protein
LELFISPPINEEQDKTKGGRLLTSSSSANNYQITCMTRDAESLKDYFNDKKGLNITEVEMSVIANSF